MALYVKIKKVYSDFILDVNIDSNNDTLALLGASGCGKSLTLKCIAGIVTPDEGEIVLNDTTLFSSYKGINIPVQKRKIGYLFQNYALFPNMTVEENVLTGLSLEKLSKKMKMEKVNRILEQFMILDLKNYKISQLSGGQQQRTALARILISRPNMLMLDEPFSALDVHLRGDMEKLLINTINQLKKDTLFVSHDRDEVYRICNRAAVLNVGKIDVCSDVERLFSNPMTLTAAKLTGCKNIADVKMLECGSVFVYDWSATLKTKNKRQIKGITAIGIRAHYFKIVNSIIENCIEATVNNIVHEPFENTIYFMPKNGTREICFKTNKEQIFSLGQQYILHIDPEYIYLLT